MDIQDDPAFRELMDSLAEEMEHLNPALSPKGDETTKLDLLRARLERMLGEPGHDPEMYEWIKRVLHAIEEHDRKQLILDELNRRLGPSSN